MLISIKYGSHLPVLSKIVEVTKGPILELGMGLYSTPYLHWTCFPTKRELTSYDNNERWIRYFRDSRRDFHKIELITDWDTLEINTFWDIALIDHAPNARRSVEAKRLANNAKYIILHDTEPEHDHLYGYSDIYHLFQYRCNYTKASPNTTVLSNFVNLKKLKDELL